MVNNLDVLFNISGNIIALTLGLVLISISISWAKKSDKYYRIVNIEDWEEILLDNINLNKKKTLLEKELIKKVLYRESDITD